MKEVAIQFGVSKTVIGIVSDPAADGSSRPAVILLNSGIIHRVGPNRLYVTLARRLARAGFVTLRFDLSGIGDSVIRRDNVPFERSAVQETQEAMEYLTTTRGVDRFLLAGICTGAVVAYHTARSDKRVLGAVLINGQGYIPESEEAIHAYLASRQRRRYYLSRALYNFQSWRKLATGRVGYGDILGSLGFRSEGRRSTKHQPNSKAAEVAAGFRSLADQGTEMLFLYSSGDPGIEELELILEGKVAELSARATVQYRVVEKADHMFTALASQEEFLRRTEDWLQEIAARSPHERRR
jgi:pimeloyl-ACP methyl ester carboxylesterase